MPEMNQYLVFFFNSFLIIMVIGFYCFLMCMAAPENFERIVDVFKKK